MRYLISGLVVVSFFAFTLQMQQHRWPKYSQNLAQQGFPQYPNSYETNFQRTPAAAPVLLIALLGMSSLLITLYSMRLLSEPDFNRMDRLVRLGINKLETLSGEALKSAERHVQRELKALNLEIEKIISGNPHKKDEIKEKYKKNMKERSGRQASH